MKLYGTITSGNLYEQKVETYILNLLCYNNKSILTKSRIHTQLCKYQKYTQKHNNLFTKKRHHFKKKLYFCKIYQTISFGIHPSSLTYKASVRCKPSLL